MPTNRCKLTSSGIVHPVVKLGSKILIPGGDGRLRQYSGSRVDEPKNEQFDGRSTLVVSLP